MITHLATPAEEEFLAGLSNVEVVRRAYESLGRCVLSQDREKELLGQLRDMEMRRMTRGRLPWS
ncbi:hypothetical protein Tco_0168509, partial [Tanacetum coccineum]